MNPPRNREGPARPRIGTRLQSLCVAAAIAGCSGLPEPSSTAGHQVTVEGPVTAIDTLPWRHDGDAEIRIRSRRHGLVLVRLPARWNLCAADPVAVEALSAGMQVRAVGTADGDGAVRVCDDRAHGVVPIE